MLLNGQTALVTGGSSGIGYAIAQGMAAAGATVAVNHRASAERAAKLVDDILTAGLEVPVALPPHCLSQGLQGFASAFADIFLHQAGQRAGYGLPSRCRLSRPQQSFEKTAIGRGGPT